MESLIAAPREVAWRVQPGDVVVTSGEDDVFPEGVTLGTVTRA